MSLHVQFHVNVIFILLFVRQVVFFHLQPIQNAITRLHHALVVEKASY